jgi:UDP-glucose 4-epimerase
MVATSGASKVVAVTGASGYIGSRLLQQLEEETEEVLEKLIAFDLKPPSVPIHNIAVYRRDLSRPIDEFLRRHRVTTLAHLAFTRNRGRNRREVREIREANLRTLHTILDSCLRAGVRHVIYLSSHTVYGVHPDNPIPLTERAPLRPLPDFPFGYDKFLSDQIFDAFAERHQDTKITILRPCAVLGPSASQDVSRIFLYPRPMGVCGNDPPFQFLHEDDLARILAIIIKRGISGVFNAAGEGVAFYREIAEIIPGALKCLPALLAYPLVKLTWELGFQRSINTAELNLMKYPVLLSTSKLEQATGYRPRYTSLEAVTAFVNSVLV